MKTAINIILALMIVAFIVSSFMIDVQAKSALHQVLGSMEMIKALLAGIILAVINKK